LSPKDKCLPAVSALGFQSPGRRPGVARMPQEGASGAKGKNYFAMIKKVSLLLFEHEEGKIYIKHSNPQNVRRRRTNLIRVDV